MYRLLFVFFPLFCLGQEITSDMFLQPIITGTNMSLAFQNPQMDQFNGGKIAAFYDLNGNGILDCVGLGDVINDFYIFSIWGDDVTTENEIDGLLENDYPIIAILTVDNKIILIENISSFQGYSTNSLIIAQECLLSSSYCNDTLYCNYSTSNYSLDSIYSNCFGIIGCMNSDYLEYNINAYCENESCNTAIVLGCLDNEAYNFNDLANLNDGSCIFSGCMNQAFMEYDSNASLDDGSCLMLLVYGCTSQVFIEYDSDANVDDGSCQNEWQMEYLGLVHTVDSITAIEDSLNQIIFIFQDSLGAFSILIDQSYADGVASVIPEDGISQLEVDSAYQAGVSSVVPEDGVTQADIDTQADLSYGYGFGDGVASVIPEDGISQLEVDSAYQAGVSSVVPEDGVTQADLDPQADLSYGYGFGDGVASVETEEIIYVNIPIDLPVGWSLFGYTCQEPIDIIQGFEEIVDKIYILKDQDGNAYFPEYNYNGIGDLHFSEGYQIKMLEQVDGFQFCPTFVNSTEQ